MLTADTITDEQIIALGDDCTEIRGDGLEYYRDENHHQIRLVCNTALNGLFGADEVAKARARCAEILNARNGR